MRGLLLEHDVDFPSNAKKADLVKLFKENVKPRATAILQSRRSVNASGHGITRIHSNASKSIDDQQSQDSLSDESDIDSKQTTNATNRSRPIRKPAPRLVEEVPVLAKKGRGRPRKSVAELPISPPASSAKTLAESASIVLLAVPSQHAESASGESQDGTVSYFCFLT